MSSEKGGKKKSGSGSRSAECRRDSLDDLDFSDVSFDSEEDEVVDPAAALRANAAEAGVLYHPSGLSEGDGRGILDAISTGDADALHGLLGATGAAAAVTPINAHEWGLGRVGGDHFIVVGGGVNVSWGALMTTYGGKPVAHSHPMNEERQLDDGIDIQHISDASHMDQCRLLPSASDATVAAEAGETVHHVYTPYVLAEGEGVQRAVNPGGEDDRPRISFRIDNPVVTGIFVQCTLTMLAGGEVLRTGPSTAIKTVPRGPLSWGNDSVHPEEDPFGE